MNRILHLATVCLAAFVLIGPAGCSKNKAIHDAARNDDLAKVKALLTAHPDWVNSKDSYGMTPLHYAAHNGDKDMVEFLLANKADVNARDKYGQTPLHNAARQGHEGVAELLLADKAEVNAKNDFGWTPLHEAAIGGHKAVAELLLTNKAEVNARDNRGDTPLHLAAMFNQKLMAEVRSGNKAGPNTNAKTSVQCLRIRQRLTVARTSRNCFWPMEPRSMPRTQMAQRLCFSLRVTAARTS
jgi:ankyrin repeat protein